MKIKKFLLFINHISFFKFFFVLLFPLVVNFIYAKSFIKIKALDLIFYQSCNVDVWCRSSAILNVLRTLLTSIAAFLVLYLLDKKNLVEGKKAHKGKWALLFLVCVVVYFISSFNYEMLSSKVYLQ